MTPRFVTPDWISDDWKNVVTEAMNRANYNSAEINRIINTVDSNSRKALLLRPFKVKWLDALKNALPLVDSSTSARMADAYMKLFANIPKDMEHLMTELERINATNYIN